MNDNEDVKDQLKIKNKEIYLNKLNCLTFINIKKGEP